MSDGSKGPLPTEASKANEMTSKPGFGLCSGMSLGVTRLLPRWCPAYRHESNSKSPRSLISKGISIGLIYVKMVDMSQYEDQPLGHLLYRVMAGLRPQVSAELGPLGLGLPEFVCMRVLSMSPGQSSAELARNTNVSPQAMNSVLRRLQDIGAVTRPASVPSGRALPARLTGKGKALLKRAEAAVHVADEQLLTRLTPAERRELKRLLHTVGSQAIDGSARACVSSNIAGDNRAMRAKRWS